MKKEKPRNPHQSRTMSHLSATDAAVVAALPVTIPYEHLLRPPRALVAGPHCPPLAR